MRQVFMAFTGWTKRDVYEMTVSEFAIWLGEAHQILTERREESPV